MEHYYYYYMFYNFLLVSCASDKKFKSDSWLSPGITCDETTQNSVQETYYHLVKCDTHLRSFII
jgi:hypothetical protein